MEFWLDTCTSSSCSNIPRISAVPVCSPPRTSSTEFSPTGEAEFLATARPQPVLNKEEEEEKEVVVVEVSLGLISGEVATDLETK